MTNRNAQAFHSTEPDARAMLKAAVIPCNRVAIQKRTQALWSRASHCPVQRPSLHRSCTGVAPAYRMCEGRKCVSRRPVGRVGGRRMSSSKYTNAPSAIKANCGSRSSEVKNGIGWLFLNMCHHLLDLLGIERIVFAEHGEEDGGHGVIDFVARLAILERKM